MQPEKEKRYFFVGTGIGEIDYIDSFMENNEWRLGWEGREEEAQYKQMLAQYNQMREGDYIILKSSYTRRINLPFDNPNNKSASVMRIKAVGIVKENLNDGHSIKVNWIKDYRETKKEWYFYTSRQAIWNVEFEEGRNSRLIKFAIDDIEQDFKFFLDQPYWKNQFYNENQREEDKSSQQEKEFKEWIHNEKVRDGKDPDKWTAVVPKIYWLKGKKEDDYLRDELVIKPIKSLLLKLENLNEEDKTLVSALPENLFSLSKDDFLEAELIISRISKEYRQELNSIIEQYNMSGTRNISYSTFKPTKFADEYKRFLSSTNLDSQKYMSKYAKKLKASKNIIFRGAPGTGKTYLARKIAAEIISNNRTSNFNELHEDEKERFEFVQFHPSYDYTDFVEGFKPISETDSSQIGFELVPGIFKKFVNKAVQSQFSPSVDNFNEAWEKFFEKVIEAQDETENGTYNIKTMTGKDMYLQPYESNGIEGVVDNRNNPRYYNKNQCYKVYQGKKGVQQGGFDNYRKAIVQHLIDEFGLLTYIPKKSIEQAQPYVFVIDEINRGEISKIFGELFFALDPGYRGVAGSVKTQYSSLQEDEDAIFYIPENVYIIGTMNDIDRSVENFDFAMRRRFRFIEIKADDTDQLQMLEVLDSYEEAKDHLISLNSEISKVNGLNDHYHIGPSYYLKLKELDNDFDMLWEEYIAPLLEEYVRGFVDEQEILNQLHDAYQGNTDEE